jgi:hypothetical protein
MSALSSTSARRIAGSFSSTASRTEDWWSLACVREEDGSHGQLYRELRTAARYRRCNTHVLNFCSACYSVMHALHVSSADCSR